MRELTERPTLTLPPLEAVRLQRAFAAASESRNAADEVSIALLVLALRLNEAATECEFHPEASVQVIVRVVGGES